MNKACEFSLISLNVSVVPRAWKSVETESRIVVSRDWNMGGKKEFVLVGEGFQLKEVEKPFIGCWWQ